MGSGGSAFISNPILYPRGDVDVYRVHATETYSTRGCGGVSLDEDSEFRTTLTVPADAGSHQVCVETNACTATPSPCLAVSAADSLTLPLQRDGASTITDVFDFYLTVRGPNAPAFACTPYTLSYLFDAGFCD